MLQRLYAGLAAMLVGLSLTGFSRPLSEAEDTGNPWWMWLLIVLALIAFVAFAVWWWRGSRREDELEGAPAVAPPESRASEAPAATAPAAEEEAAVQLALPTGPEEPKEPTEPDDLTRVEGIGPKISSVLQAAGITTYTALASSSPDQIRQILGDASPNLLRLADPTTWPQQAGLAARGDWDGLEALQGDLKGGRQAT